MRALNDIFSDLLSVIFVSEVTFLKLTWALPWKSRRQARPTGWEARQAEPAETIPHPCLRPSYAAGMQIINGKRQNSHISWVGTLADLAAPASATGLAEKVNELHELLERDVEIGKETWIPLTARCLTLTLTRKAKPLLWSFGRKPWGAGVWPSGAEDKVAGDRWQVTGGVWARWLPLPARLRHARLGEAHSQAVLPSGASETAEVETWLRPSAHWPKGLCWHKGGSVLEGVHRQLLQPGRGWAEEVCSFPGLCLHPCAMCRYPLRAPAVLQWLGLSPGC